MGRERERERRCGRVWWLGLGLAAVLGVWPSAVGAQVNFLVAPSFPAGDSPPVSVASGDIDGDGDLDIVTANTGEYPDYSNTVSVLLNNGNGTFAPPQSFAVGNSPTSVALGDLDGDGDLDIATANIGGFRDYSGTVSVLLNRGDGSFAPAQSFAVGDFPRSVALGDLDGDGDLDLATANLYSDTVSVLSNNGNGSFAPAQSFAAGDYPTSVALGDLDGDGDLDIATASRFSNNVSVLLNDGRGSFGPAQSFAVGDRPQFVALGDLDGDGDLDIVTANTYSDTVSVLSNNGNGSFAPAQAFAVGNSPTSVALGDLDGDGDLDLATANGISGDVSVLLNSGSGTFAPARLFVAGNSPVSVAVGDLDGDGDLDIATANRVSPNGTVSVLLNSGGDTFAAAQSFRVDVYPTSVALGDLDGDGDLDITATANGISNNGTVSVLLNSGDGSFAPVRSFTVGLSPRSVALGDLDGDGDLDIATANGISNNGTVSVLLNSGDGSFAPARSFTVGLSPRSVALGDLDGDGDLDIATANNRSYDASVLLNSGDGTFSPPQSFAVSGDPNAVTLGDLDGDLDLDIATANSNSNTVTVLRNITQKLAPPTIAALTPRVGRVGTEVTITGTGFTGATAVTFRLALPQQRLPAEFTVVSDTEIRAVVPAQAKSGRVSVETPVGSATSPQVFLVVGP